ncbi:restriction endonuclease subunit S [Shewanella mangrovisoli]|uniref:restriction endonuclease subunit S n=1 Tax=Shewanella mangrovisoli TaxID=2864211 RepID=UPI0035BB12D5
MSELPSNWVQLNLGDECVSIKGKKPSILSPTAESNLVPYVDIKAFEKGILSNYAAPKDGVFADVTDTLMVWDGARSGLVGNGVEGVIGSTLVRIRPKYSDNRYLHYFLKSQFGYINSNTKGTGIPHVDPAKLWSIPYPLAPLNEQKRIADKLDSILAKVNKAQERLDKIPSILKRFRQSVLAAATSGELTREWRGYDAIVTTDIEGLSIPVEWQFCTVEDIGVVKGGKRLPKGDELTENNTGFPYIRAGQLKNGTVVQGDSARNRQMFLAPETQAQIKRYTVNEGDVYLTIVGASIGDAGVIPHALHQANLTENAAKITNFNEKISAQYLSIWLRSERLQELIQLEIKSGAQGKLALKRINTLPVPLPPIAEQHEIVSIVEVLLSRAETLDRSYQLVKSRVDRLVQSILAKAFRGELVDQNPSDEPADMLLERIKQQQREAPKTTRQTRKPAAKVIPSVDVVETDVELTPPESEIFALLKNTRGELSAQQIMDKLTEKTFEQVDALFTELKRLLDNNAIVKVGSGEACTFKAIKR